MGTQPAEAVQEPRPSATEARLRQAIEAALSARLKAAKAYIKSSA